MKDILKKFFNSKFNIIMTVIQVLAIIMLVLSSWWSWGLIVTIVLEGLFFVTLGIKQIFSNKVADKQLDLTKQLLKDESDIERLEKLSKKRRKGNVFSGLTYIILGVILIFILIL